MGHTTRVMAHVTGFMGYTTRVRVLGIMRSCNIIKVPKVRKVMIRGGSIVVAVSGWTRVIQRMDHRTKHRIPMFKYTECDECDNKVKHDAISIETIFCSKFKFKLNNGFNGKYLIDYTLQINNNNSQLRWG